MLTPQDVFKFIDQFDHGKKQIASVAAHTGTGKSTMFPTGFFMRGKTIFVIQPTITAAVGIAGFLKKSLPEDSIGTAADREVKYYNSVLYPHHNKITPMVYCTAGHLRNILLKFAENKQPKKFCDYIFLDEAHTGDLQYDTIMYIYKYLMGQVGLNQPSALPRLILITATPGIYPFKDSEVYKAEYPGAKSYPVDIYYHDRDYKTSGKDIKDLFKDTAAIVAQWHKDNPVPEDETDGWLVFCPGKKEIQGVVAALQSSTTGTVLIPLYSSMSDENAIHYDYVPPPGVRKIIVSTNVAEASLTIENLSGVFDTLVEKITVEGRKGANMLTMANISQTSAKQRKGRTGRNLPGFCYRMCTEKFFNRLDLVKKREIERIAPDTMILDLLSRHLAIEDVVTDNAIPKRIIKEATDRLTTIGLLTSDKAVTVAADFVKTLPLSPRNGMFLWLWTQYAEYNPYIGSVITAVMESYGGGFFYRGDDDPPLEKIIRSKFYPVQRRFMASAEPRTSLKFNLMLIMHIIDNFRSIDPSKVELKTYCGANNLNNQRVGECLKNIRNLITGAGNRSKGPIMIGNFDIESNLSKALPFIYQCYADLVYSGGSADAKRYAINSEVDNFVRSKIGDRIIPIYTFDTQFKTYVQLYHTVGDERFIKIVPRVKV